MKNRTRSQSRDVRETSWSWYYYTSDPTRSSIQSKNGLIDFTKTRKTGWRKDRSEASYPLYRLEDSISWDGNGKQYFHSCSHTKREWQASYPTQTLSFDAERWAKRYPNHIRYGDTSTVRKTNGAPGIVKITPSFPDDPVIGSVDWQGAWQSLLDDAYGLMPDDISIGVNVAQLSQLKNMVPHIARSIRRLVKWATGQTNKRIRVWKYLYDKSGRRIPWTGVQTTVEVRSMSWSLRQLADLHLVSSFGVLPLADDVANWATKLLSVQAHMKAWEAHAGRTVVLHGRTPDIRSQTDNPKTRVYSGAYYDALQSVSTEYSAYGVIGAKVYVEPKQWEDRCSAMIRQVLGLNVPLQVAWDLVPFSFVVDWFLPVGETIRRVEPRRFIGGLAAKVRIWDIWHSNYANVQRTTRISYSLKGDQDFVASIDGDVRIDAKSSVYTRTLGMPYLNWLPSRKTRFGIKQVLLSVSLAVQRLIK